MFKEFRIGDLFEIINNPQLDRVNFNFDEHAEYPYFTRTENNNGILGYVDYLDDEHKIQGNSLAVGMISMKFHYMAHDFYAGQFTKTLIPKFDEFNEILALYFIVVLNKHSEHYQGFLVRHFKDKVSETAVFLPIIESSDPNHVYTVDDIDWQYMQDRIAELEQDRIAELEAYLAATGLDDYALTDEDKAVLCDGVKMVEFRIGDVFYKIDTPKIKAKANDFLTEYSEEYSIPLLTAGAENQGLNRWAKTSDCFMVINNVISVSANGANSGVCFYQPQNFAVLQDAYAVKVHNHEIGSVEEGLYLTGALNKAVRDNHSWVNKAGWNRIKDDIVELPVIASSDPNHTYTIDDIDFDYMEQYIRAMEKLAIADVVKYKDKVIATTRQVVEQ